MFEKKKLNMTRNGNMILYSIYLLTVNRKAIDYSRKHNSRWYLIRNDEWSARARPGPKTVILCASVKLYLRFIVLLCDSVVVYHFSYSAWKYVRGQKKKWTGLWFLTWDGAAIFLDNYPYSILNSFIINTST